MKEFGLKAESEENCESVLTKKPNKMLLEISR